MSPGEFLQRSGDLSRMRWFRVLMLFASVIFSACSSPLRDTPPTGEQLHKSIYLVSHGWHAGIVLRRSDIANKRLPVVVDFPDADYLEVGWGDKDYYQTPDAHIGIIMKAALLPTDSVLHIVGFNKTVASYFPNSEIISIELSATGFEKLIRRIATSFARDEAGNLLSMGPGLYGNSRFYLSTERYHLFNTCNVWTARLLQTAGLAMTPATAISVEGLMSQTRKIGVVLQTE